MLKGLSLGSSCLALVASYFANEGHAQACSPAEAPEGYIVGIKTETFITGDPNSPVVCSQMNSCGTAFKHKSAREYLSVFPTINASAGTAGEVKLVRGDRVTYTMRDAADMELEKFSGTGFGVSFSKLGTKVCVQVSPASTDASVSGPSEICIPVTVTSLDVSAQESAEYDAQIAKACPAGANAGTGGGGCAIGGAQRGVSKSSFGLLVLAALIGCAGRLRKIRTN
jgi:hypothetical protein